MATTNVSTNYVDVVSMTHGKNSRHTSGQYHVLQIVKTVLVKLTDHHMCRVISFVLVMVA